MLIEVSNTLTVENPTPEMVLWCKRNLTIPNPEYAKKSRMNLWLGNTPKVLSLYETRGTTLVLPFGTLRLLPKDISDKALFLSEFAAPVEVNYNADVPLYDYQETAVQAMVAAKYGILQSAAGSGKTQMGIALAARLGRRTLWLCHTLDLIKQSKERAKLYMSEDLMGTITEGKVNLGEGITFATIQTMCKLDLAQYRDYWDCIITDEVHRVSGSPTAVTQYQKVLNSLSARHKYGLSATVHRSDGMIRATYALVGEVAYKVPDEAVADKIMKVGIYPIGTGVQISREALNTDGTLNYTKLITYLTENAARNQLIADSIEQRPSLILSDRLNHLETLISLLPVDMQKDAVMISGKMTTKKGKPENIAPGLEAGDNTKFLSVNMALMNMTDIDMENPLEVQQRLSDYFALYAQYDMKPTVVGMAIALNGHNRQWLYAVTHDAPTGGAGYKTALPPEVAGVIKKAYFLLENLWENYMQSGKVNPVAGIFLGKNNYGYQDKTEYVLTPNQQNDNDYSADEIRERYIASDQQKRLSASNSDEDTSD